MVRLLLLDVVCRFVVAAVTICFYSVAFFAAIHSLCMTVVPRPTHMVRLDPA